jgi:hypothetical protein
MRKRMSPVTTVSREDSRSQGEREELLRSVALLAMAAAMSLSTAVTMARALLG